MSRFGVGGALQIMPVTITAASIATFVAPGVWSTGAARLAEAATRYSFNRTGMELLYLPLPAELRNRTKAFTDIFVDRFSRGIGGVLLIFLTGTLDLTIKQLAIVVMIYSAAWIVLSIRAKNEYIATVRKRLQLGRLDLDSLRVSVTDAATIRLLEQTSESDNARQAAYALSLLAEARGYPLEKRLRLLASSKVPAVRGKVFELARERRFADLMESALAELRTSRAGESNEAIEPAVAYAVAMAPDPVDVARRLLTHPNSIVAQTALEAIAQRPEATEALITQRVDRGGGELAEPQQPRHGGDRHPHSWRRRDIGSAQAAARSGAVRGRGGQQNGGRAGESLVSGRIATAAAGLEREERRHRRAG